MINTAMIVKNVSHKKHLFCTITVLISCNDLLHKGGLQYIAKR